MTIPNIKYATTIDEFGKQRVDLFHKYIRGSFYIVLFCLL